MVSFMIYKYTYSLKILLENRVGCPHCVTVKAMDCGIKVSESVLQSITFAFRQIPLGKV